jgi:hypothetical protein
MPIWLARSRSRISEFSRRARRIVSTSIITLSTTFPNQRLLVGSFTAQHVVWLGELYGGGTWVRTQKYIYWSYSNLPLHVGVLAGEAIRHGSAGSDVLDSPTPAARSRPSSDGGVAAGELVFLLHLRMPDG